MANASNKQKLTKFVRTTPGCRCPDAVFDKIDSSRIALGGLAGASTRIVVGGTHFIYLVSPTSIGIAPRLGENGAVRPRRQSLDSSAIHIRWRQHTDQA